LVTYILPERSERKKEMTAVTVEKNVALHSAGEI
jgi:hypothetical protein